MTRHDPKRRQFLRLGAATAGAAAAGAGTGQAAPLPRLVIAGKAPIMQAPPVQWALGQLATACLARNITLAYDGPGFTVTLAADTKLANAEALRIAPVKGGLKVTAGGARGMAYALGELADRVRHAPPGEPGLRLAKAIQESPANRVRGVSRYFVSSVEDKAWWTDKSFWTAYLDALAEARFNRFTLALGLGYDAPIGITENYFHFAYPYLLAVPGYDVKVVELPDAERDANLAMLQFVAKETARRGMAFQLGLWTHAYDGTNSPGQQFHYSGLNQANHAAYCRDALTQLLHAVPEIGGLTMRVHGESGIAEGSWDFWTTLFDAFAKAGRPVEIDMHAKGITPQMIDIAKATGMPMVISPKFCGEHMGLGYHQADIRAFEFNRTGEATQNMQSISANERRFTRYSYADLFVEGRPYDVWFRMWPGSQRHLAWGDPELAAAFSRSASFCGAMGLDLMEPLTFKGREGSGHADGRTAYADKTLDPGAQDWEKFAYYYRVWGRLLYNPDSDPAVWRRWLMSRFGAAAAPMEAALGRASQILPLFFHIHCPSTSNRGYWPELYTDMAIVPGDEPAPYKEMTAPYSVARVSPLDPQLFASIEDHAADLIAGRTVRRYSPTETLGWLEDATSSAEAALLKAQALQVPAEAAAEFRRWCEDVRILVGLGRFFTGKLRAALFHEIWRLGGPDEAGKLAMTHMMRARDAWAVMAERAAKIYVADISYGEIKLRRGHWSERLALIDHNIGNLRTALAQPRTVPAAANGAAALAFAQSRPWRPIAAGGFMWEGVFTPGQPYPVKIDLLEPVKAVTLWYRHVNQGERWRAAAMAPGGKPITQDSHPWTGAIPGEYTQSPYPLQLYYEIDTGAPLTSLEPGIRIDGRFGPYVTIDKRI